MRRLSLLLLLFIANVFVVDHVIVLRAARLIDGRSNNVVMSGLVVIRNDHIESIGGTAPVLSVTAIESIQMIDLGDATLLPGLIDSHVHTLLQGDVMAEEYDEQIFKESPAYRALRASRAVKIGFEHNF